MGLMVAQAGAVAGHTNVSPRDSDPSQTAAKPLAPTAKPVWLPVPSPAGLASVLVNRALSASSGTATGAAGSAQTLRQARLAVTCVEREGIVTFAWDGEAVPVGPTLLRYRIDSDSLVAIPGLSKDGRQVAVTGLWAASLFAGFRKGVRLEVEAVAPSAVMARARFDISGFGPMVSAHLPACRL
jgi:hypothetical protein